MFAYCGNNPIFRSDPSGHFGLATLPLIVSTDIVDAAITLLVCCASSLQETRAIVACVPSLLDYDENEMSSLSDKSYNCVGNGLGKKINCCYLPGYTPGMSTRQAFGLIQELVGKENIRELKSINDEIGEDEFRGAFRCGPTDLHFIRQLGNGQWYNKSGTTHGLPIPAEVVTNGIDATGWWYGMWMNNDGPWYDPYTFYNDEIIYYALKKEWWK